MDGDYGRQFGSAIRRAEGTPDEDGTLPAAPNPRTGQWGIVGPPRVGNGTILLVASACITAVAWFAT